MAVPFIQLGQCGNQVGSAFYSKLFDEGQKASSGHQALLEQFFQSPEQANNSSSKYNMAKTLLIDMEPKVVNKNLSHNKPWKYNKHYSLVQQEGSGNNWAYGCKVHGPRVQQLVLQRFRRLAEAEDYIKCLFQIQSLAGGTGSGMGTFIFEKLSEYHPKIPKFNICVMPHLSGEVILQSYNAVLSLSTLYQESDGIMLIENDSIQKICNRQLNLAKPTLDEINEVIGRQLASVFFPVVNRHTQKVYSVQQNEFNYAEQLVEHVVWDPRFKLISVKTAPNTPKNSQSFNYDSWLAVENDVYGKSSKLKSKGSILIARGPDHPETLSNTNSRWLLDSHSFNNYHRSVTLVDNSQYFVEALDQIVRRCHQMLSQNAYIYQYQKYGVQKINFIQHLAVMETIVHNYQTM